MRQLNMSEIEYVSGGSRIAPVTDIGAVLDALSDGSFFNPQAVVTARRLQAYRAAHPSDTTWYADFFQL